jgi:HAD superfamily hydrolase (TIGR01490 family)
MAAGIDFFDVDHTIIRRSSGVAYVSLAISKGVLPWRISMILPWYSLTYRLGIFRLREYAEGFPYLRGIRRTVLEEIADECFDRKLRAAIYDEAASLVEERRKAGRRVMLATSSLDFIVAPLLRHLNMDGVLATSLEFDQGVCTGRIVGVPMFRREKKVRVVEYLRRERVNPSECSFYSDSVFDLPLLETVGHPTAINPDFRLRRAARRRNWPIIDLS